MFTLRQTHNEAFQSKAEADFVREVMQYLRENHAETIVKLPNGEFKVIDLPEETLRKMVEGGIAKARSYGITWRSTLISFVVIMFVSAPNFDENKAVNDVLENSGLTPNLRIDEIWEVTFDETWGEVEKNYQISAWNF
jgi:hypothetical protein